MAPRQEGRRVAPMKTSFNRSIGPSAGLFDVPPEDVELVAKHGVLDDQLVPGTIRVSGEPRELASGAAKVEFRPESADSAPDSFRHSRNREQPHLAIRPRVAVEADDNLEFQLRIRADARGSQHGGEGFSIKRPISWPVCTFRSIDQRTPSS